MKFVVTARGHENVRAEHKTTLEVTKEKHLTPRGDCIIGVEASASASELPEWLKEHLRSGGKILVRLKLPEHGLEEEFTALGDRRMTFSHRTDVVFRKSNYVCGRTVGVKATKAARDLNREIVELLKDRRVELIVEILPL
ncbi:MAG: DUF371 domain-containing protein [Archaeoglobaceae archaeon]